MENRWWFDDSVPERALRRARDAYRVVVEIELEGDAYSKKSYGGARASWEEWSDWRYGAKRYAGHVVPLGGVTPWNLSSIKADLIVWMARVDEQLSQLADLRERGGPMTAFADESERVVRAADGLTDEVSRVLQLLYGVELYGYRSTPHREPEVRVAREPALTLEPGSWRQRTRRELASGEVEERRTNGELYPFGRPNGALLAANGARGQALDTARQLQLLLWKFDAADYAAFDSLLSRYDEIERELTFDPRRIDRSRLGQLASRGDLSGLYGAVHRTFRDPLLLAIRAVARLAFVLAPAPTERASLIEMRDSLAVEKLLAGPPARSMPRLPPETSVLALLAIPLTQLTAEERGSLDASGDPAPGEWFALWPGSTTSRADTTRLEVTTRPGSTHRLEVRDHVAGVFSLVGAASASGSLAGEYTLTLARNDLQTVDAGKAEVRERSSSTMRVRWRVENELATASPDDEPMVLTFTRRIGDRYLPFDQPIAFGEAFYVEGRLEKPATRPVYRIVLQVPGGDSAEVFLQRTEEDLGLLRSDMHYLMWDVADFDDAADPGAREPGGRGAP